MPLLLMAGLVKTNAQTWTPPVFHEGDIYIDPNCKAANCLNGMEATIQQQLQILKAAPCGKTINVIVLNEDCPPVKAERLGDDQWILKGPDMPLQGNPSTSSDVWWAQDHCGLLIITPYYASFQDYQPDPIWGLTGYDDRPIYILQRVLEDDFAKSYVPFSSKYACLIFEFLKQYALKEAGTSCAATLNVPATCNETNTLGSLPVLEYTSGGGFASGTLTDEKFGVNMTGYDNVWVKHFKSSYCTDLQVVVPTTISQYVQLQPDYAALVKNKINKSDFVLIMAPIGTEAPVDVFLEKGSSLPSNPPIADKCYPQSRFLNGDDAGKTKEYVESFKEPNGHPQYGSGFRAVQYLHQILAAKQAPQPGLVNCEETSGPNPDWAIPPDESFPQNQVVKQTDLKLTFKDGQVNPANTQEKVTGGLHDFTGGLEENLKNQFVLAAEHIGDLYSGADKIDFQFVTSVSRVQSGIKVIASFIEGKKKFETISNDIKNRTDRAMVVFYNYDLGSGNMYFQFAGSDGFYKTADKGGPISNTAWREGANEMMVDINQAFLKQIASNYQTARPSEPLENAEQMNAQGLDHWEMGLWQGVSPGKVGTPGLVSEAMVMVAETAWEMEFPQRLWDSSKRGNGYFKLPGAIAGVGDGLLNQINGKVVGLIGLARTAKEFATNKESRLTILAAMRYPHMMVIAQYGQKIKEALTTSNPEVRWHHAGFLGTEVIMGFTSGGFLTNLTSGLTKDLKKLGTDATKVATLTGALWFSGYNKWTRKDIKEHDPNPDHPDPDKPMEVPPRQRVINDLIGEVGKISEDLQKKIAHESGIVRDLLLLGLDENGAYKTGWDQQKLVELVKELPAVEHPYFYQRLELILRDGDGNVKEDIGLKFMDDATDPLKGREFVETLRDHVELMGAWELAAAANLQYMRKSWEFLRVVREFQTGARIQKYASYGCTMLDEAFIRYYTGGSYKQLNDALNGLVPLTNELAEYKTSLNAALNKLPDQPGKVYRGLGPGEASIYNSLNVGDIRTEQKFISTSTSYSRAKNFAIGKVILTIQTSTGKYIAPISQFSNEKEVLLGTGKKLRVDEIIDGDIKIIKVTEIE